MERADRAPSGFLWGFRRELLKVDPPTLRELATGTKVVLVTIAAMTSFVFAVDATSAKAVVTLLTS